MKIFGIYVGMINKILNKFIYNIFDKIVELF